MAKSLSPLRYPGGKSKIYNKVKKIIKINKLNNKTYVEPFAGGFGIGIGLLCDDIVQSVVLNDFDPHIYHFWYSVLHHTESLLKLITDTPITLEERKKQKAIYKDRSSDEMSDGFATLFLNRVNFSGIIMGGPLGGKYQNSKYKIDCRFNKSKIVKKIKQIALLKNSIELYNCDASELITIHLQNTIYTSFFNIDPPYVKKGHKLYANYFKEEDHRKLERVITKYLSKTQWIVTYDDCDLIRDIYRQYHILKYGIQYNVGSSGEGNEIIITNIPKSSFIW
ncbi:MAG: adenine methylase [Kosmotogales bacterium]|nr:adenine methylase [Kosmotogales bacterium]